MGGSFLLILLASMIVDDFSVFGVGSIPAETEPELIVDAYAVLPGAVALQRFQPIAGRNAQEIKRGRRVELHQLAPGDGLDRSKTPHRRPIKQTLRILAAKCLDRHLYIVYRYAI